MKHGTALHTQNKSQNDTNSFGMVEKTNGSSNKNGIRRRVDIYKNLEQLNES